ncbi:MAG TPA: primosomal protein N' [Cryomorphaceae bacterium]|nr:primosomal protein N' [Cryomorphaceae bacterium]|tara:strand:- start:114 stop:2543 length:2430 start_codon:yes stop_codon:yes gene_type:complete
MLVAEVILPLPLDKVFHYAVPNEFAGRLVAGIRVLVQFGKRKEYAALVVRVLETEEDLSLKYLISVLDERPVVLEHQILQWKWMSGYYMAPVGDLMNAALPPGLKLSSHSILVHNPEVLPEEGKLSDSLIMLYEGLLGKEKLTLDEVRSICNVKNPMPLVQQALEEGWAVLEEELKKVARAKRRKLIRIAPEYLTRLDDAFQATSRSEKQTQALLTVIAACGSENSFTDSRGFRKKHNIESAQILALKKKGLVEEIEEVDGTTAASAPHSDISLSGHQIFALAQIEEGFDSGKPTLLHGVTASGKTEIYIELIKTAFEFHRRVLYLLPEIALTTQLINRLRIHFTVAVNHSRFTPAERLAAWRESLERDEPLLVLGARSALFMPLPDLGLIIVDEEHESSFKQYEPSPRYHARDTAVWMANQHNCPILLGSATPSLDSMFNAKAGRYHLVQLFQRFHTAPLPEIEVVDMVGAKQRKEVKGNFSIELVDAMCEALKKDESIILFQNRRGFSTFQQCQICGHVEGCTRCDISLTYHKGPKQLKCHYCGYQTPPVMKCSSCGGQSVLHKGFGTEQIAEEAAALFPKARVKRMDLDTTRGKHAFGDLIRSVEQGEVDILVGTQMVTKGLDFHRVGLVGIMSADNLLSYPDFRANERAFQLIEQVSGRTGRRTAKGKVVIQSMKPRHAIIQLAMNHDYDGMLQKELMIRNEYSYPPYVRLITITMKHRDQKLLQRAAGEFARSLQSMIGDRFLGPEFAPIARLKNLYQMQIIVKVDKGSVGAKVRKRIKKAHNEILLSSDFHKVKVVFDVDPNS